MLLITDNNIVHTEKLKHHEKLSDFRLHLQPESCNSR